MTGMGEDGAEGLGAIKAAGGATIAQSEETCVVAGMPRAAIVKGYANKIIPLDGIASFLVSQCGTDRLAAEKPERAEADDKDKFDKRTVSPLRS